MSSASCSSSTPPKPIQKKFPEFCKIIHVDEDARTFKTLILFFPSCLGINFALNIQHYKCSYFITILFNWINSLFLSNRCRRLQLSSGYKGSRSKTVKINKTEIVSVINNKREIDININDLYKQMVIFKETTQHILCHAILVRISRVN